MHILVSNDDGIYADGLAGLYLALKDLGEVSVVAPEREQSGTGHGITVHFPLRPRKVVLVDGSTGWAVDGTPVQRRCGLRLPLRRTCCAVSGAPKANSSGMR